MPDLPPMTDADRKRVSDAVAAAERTSAGEFVTIMAARSDDYRDVALAWAAGVALVALVLMALVPDFFVGLHDRLTGAWAREWTPGRLLGLAALVATIKFAATWLILLAWPRLLLALVPAPVRRARVHARAVAAFRIGAERRTAGRTGILVYMSLAERRAEIVADEAIAARVEAEAWGDALAALLVELRAGRMADGLIAAIERAGAIVSRHFPAGTDDSNELPDRLIEV